MGGSRWAQISNKGGVADQPLLVWYENIPSALFGFVTKHACDRQTNRQTYDCQERVSIVQDKTTCIQVAAKHAGTKLSLCYWAVPPPGDCILRWADFLAFSDPWPLESHRCIQHTQMLLTLKAWQTDRQNLYYDIFKTDIYSKSPTFHKFFSVECYNLLPASSNRLLFIKRQCKPGFCDVNRHRSSRCDQTTDHAGNEVQQNILLKIPYTHKHDPLPSVLYATSNLIIQTRQHIMSKHCYQSFVLSSETASAL